eukprot:scaffold3238_cov91-Cylindrotheca_fusiformis.AAC.9
MLFSVVEDCYLASRCLVEFSDPCQVVDMDMACQFVIQNISRILLFKAVGQLSLKVSSKDGRLKRVFIA